MKLSSISTFTNKFEVIENEKPKIILNSMWYDEPHLDLKYINTMIVSSLGEYTLLSTKNSTETKAVVEKMSKSHREVRYDPSTGESSNGESNTYVSTDYSGGDVVLKVLLKMK